MTNVHINESESESNADSIVKTDPEQRQRELRHDFHLPETPDIQQLEPHQRLVAIGDIHGNFGLLLHMLMASELIASDTTTSTNFSDHDGPCWTGDNAICVFVGDLLDRGYQEEKCLRLICRLGREAQRCGGAVTVLWGNHEVCNAEGDFTCTCDQTAFQKSFAPAIMAPGPLCAGDDGRNTADPFAVRRQIFARGGLLAHTFLSKLKVVTKVGRSIFVHGGLLPMHLVHFGGGMESIRCMNRDAQAWALGECGKEIYRKPLWMRDYSSPAKSLNLALQSELMEILKTLDADRLVVGHTVQAMRGGVNAIANDALWRIDVGNGRRQYAFGASPSCDDDTDHKYLRNLALEIKKGRNGKEHANTIQRTVRYMTVYNL
jgi:Calcineurin-like phosphoesterase